MLKNETSARRFYGKHFWPGVAEYHEGDKVSRVLLLEDTIRRMNPTFEGKPVFVKHVDDVITKPLDELKQEADGWVVRSFYNESDGDTWAEFMIVSKKGLQAIENGWRLSNAYVKTKVNPKKGQWNGVDYDEEILDGEYEHLAIVDNPRYEQSIILTPDQFKEYNEKKKAELNRVSNDKSDLAPIINPTEKARQMVKKIIKNRLVQNSPVAIALGKFGGRLAQLLKRRGEALKGQLKAAGQKIGQGMKRPATDDEKFYGTALTAAGVLGGSAYGAHKKNPYEVQAELGKQYLSEKKKRTSNPVTGKAERKYYKIIDLQRDEYQKMKAKAEKIKDDYNRLYEKYYYGNSKSKLTKNFHPLRQGVIPALAAAGAGLYGYLSTKKPTKEDIKAAQYYKKYHSIDRAIAEGEADAYKKALERYAFLKEWEKAQKKAGLKKANKLNKKNVKNKKNSKKFKKNSVVSGATRLASKIAGRPVGQKFLASRTGRMLDEVLGSAALAGLTIGGVNLARKLINQKDSLKGLTKNDKRRVGLITNGILSRILKLAAKK
jgi:hypothetical protein